MSQRTVAATADRGAMRWVCKKRLRKQKYIYYDHHKIVDVFYFRANISSIWSAGHITHFCTLTSNARSTFVEARPLRLDGDTCRRFQCEGGGLGRTKTGSPPSLGGGPPVAHARRGPGSPGRDRCRCGGDGVRRDRARVDGASGARRQARHQALVAGRPTHEHGAGREPNA